MRFLAPRPLFAILAASLLGLALISAAAAPGARAADPMAAGPMAAGPMAASGALTPAQKSAVDGLVHDYILAHPEVILEAVQGLHDRQQQAAADNTEKLIAANKRFLRNDPSSYVAGNPQGDVTIVEFFDYRCPYCKEMVPTIAALLKEDGKIRLVLKEYPVLGPDSLFASRAAVAALELGHYEPFHDALMASRGSLNETVVMAKAAQSGIDVAKLKTAMADPHIMAELRANRALGDELRIDGTPGFVIGDTLVPGAISGEQLRELVAAARRQCHTC